MINMSGKYVMEEVKTNRIGKGRLRKKRKVGKEEVKLY